MLNEKDLVEEALRKEHEALIFGTEVAYSALIRGSVKMGMVLEPCVGLDYIPEQDVITQFKEACRQIIRSLQPSRES
jgi:hypothetical protein